MTYLAVRPTTTVEKIKERGKEADQTVFPVVGHDDEYLGLIYMGDIDQFADAKTAGEVLERAKALGRSRDTYILDSDSLDAAKVLMRQNRLTFVPVVDKRRHYIGTLDIYST